MFLENREAQPPSISALAAKSVSDHRRNGISDQIDNGIYKEGTSKQNSQYTVTANRPVTSLVGHTKTAQVVASGAQGFRGSADVDRQIPEIYSPLWLNSNISLPRDRATINAWSRSFFALNPIVQNAISLHSTYPISKLNIKCADKRVENFFGDMADEIDLLNICVQIAQEFWLLGEAFPFAEMDKNTGKWSRIVIQNPDYMIVKRTVLASEPMIMMRPDENLKRLVQSPKPMDIEQRRQLSPFIIDAVKRGNNIPLPNYNISHIARRISPYEVHGTGLPVSIFRQLMLFDKLYESKFAQADDMINPVTVVKIGSTDYKPTIADLDAWKDIFAQAQADKNFKIFTHEGVAIERVGAGGGIYDISGDIDRLIKFMYIGLMVPQVIVEGGGDIPYSNATVSVDVLRQRYMTFRSMISAWLRRKIFEPICKIQEFYTYEEGERKLIIPDVEWNHMSLFDTGDYVQNLISLSQGESEAKRASTHSLYRSIGLDWQDEQRYIRKESIQTEIVKKEKAALAAMSLNDLRSLNDDSEINEPKEGEQAPLPGEQAPSGEGMGLPGGLGGGPDLGGPPDMGMAPPPAP